MIVSALIIIVAAIILPLANYLPSEIFPNEYSVKFSHILEVIKKGEGIFEYAPSLIFIIAVGCAVLLLIGGICRSKGLCMAASLCGIIGMLIPAFKWVEMFDISIIIGTKGTITAIGYWVCIVMFLGSFVGAFNVKRDKKKTPKMPVPTETSGFPELTVDPSEDYGTASPASPASPTPPASSAPPAATGASKLRSTMGMGKGATKKTSTEYSPKDYGFLENKDL